MQSGDTKGIPTAAIGSPKQACAACPPACLPGCCCCSAHLHHSSNVKVLHAHVQKELPLHNLPQQNTRAAHGRVAGRRVAVGVARQVMCCRAERCTFQRPTQHLFVPKARLPSQHLRAPCCRACCRTACAAPPCRPLRCAGRARAAAGAACRAHPASRPKTRAASLQQTSAAWWAARSAGRPASGPPLEMGRGTGERVWGQRGCASVRHLPSPLKPVPAAAHRAVPMSPFCCSRWASAYIHCPVGVVTSCRRGVGAWRPNEDRPSALHVRANSGEREQVVFS